MRPHIHKHVRTLRQRAYHHADSSQKVRNKLRNKRMCWNCEAMHHACFSTCMVRGLCCAGRCCAVLGEVWVRFEPTNHLRLFLPLRPELVQKPVYVRIRDDLLSLYGLPTDRRIDGYGCLLNGSQIDGSSFLA